MEEDKELKMTKAMVLGRLLKRTKEETAQYEDGWILGALSDGIILFTRTNLINRRLHFI